MALNVLFALVRHGLLKLAVDFTFTEEKRHHQEQKRVGRNVHVKCIYLVCTLVNIVYALSIRCSVDMAI